MVYILKKHNAKCISLPPLWAAAILWHNNASLFDVFSGHSWAHNAGACRQQPELLREFMINMVHVQPPCAWEWPLSHPCTLLQWNSLSAVSRTSHILNLRLKMDMLLIGITSVAAHFSTCHYFVCSFVCMCLIAVLFLCFYGVIAVF